MQPIQLLAIIFRGEVLIGNDGPSLNTSYPREHISRLMTVKIMVLITLKSSIIGLQDADLQRVVIIDVNKVCWLIPVDL